MNGRGTDKRKIADQQPFFLVRQILSRDLAKATWPKRLELGQDRMLLFLPSQNLLKGEGGHRIARLDENTSRRECKII